MKYIITTILLFVFFGCMKSIKNKENTTNMPWVNNTEEHIDLPKSQTYQGKDIDYETPYLIFSLIGLLVFFIGFFPLFYAFYNYLKSFIKKYRKDKS